MNVYQVDLDLKLAGDALIDLFIIQWHTPMPVRGHAPSKIGDKFVEEKREILKKFGEWLVHECEDKTLRPMIIVAPELSLPESQVHLLEELVQNIHRPTVVIAGLEYLRWDDYYNLVRALPDMPESEAWLIDGQAHHWVNAARIWVREESGKIKKFVQPKRHAQADEQALPLFQGNNAIVFRSLTQTHGCRLNFVTQICSDFTNVSFVRELRQRVASKCEGLCLDLTFLLQMNRDQEAGQFKQAVKEYFEPPTLSVHTEDGSLLFVNNANYKHGKSSEWGDSKFHFAFQRSWPSQDFAPPTYWMRKDGPHNYQAVALRERGPGIYWVRYKPHYLVSRTPGSEQLVPFPNTHALFAPITGKCFGDTTLADPFVAIPAVCHWLHSEWDEGHFDLGHSLQANGTDSNIANHYLEAYDKGAEEWKRAFKARDDVSRATLSIYYECWQGNIHRGFPATEVEPLSWCSDVRRGAKSMMDAYSLLKLGVAGFPLGSLQACPGEVSHAASADELRTTLLWGGNQFQPDVMTTRYLAARKERGATDSLCRKCLLVLLQPLGRMSFENLSKRFNEEATEITKGVADDALGLVKQGDVVSVAPPEIKWIYADDLIGQVSQAGNPTELESRLADVIRSALA